jgi:exodeoxyribonuclease VII large subunit
VSRRAALTLSPISPPAVDILRVVSLRVEIVDTAILQADTRAPRALTVSELSLLIRDTLTANPVLGRVTVRGETTNVQRIPTGTIFFSLKDEESQLPCILFKDDAAGLAFDITDGMDVVVSGGIDFYARKGEVRLVARSIEPVGVGLFWATFQRSRKRLEAEGLFDDARKRPLPRFPRRIGLVTSETGAVLHDLLTILRRRWPLAHVTLSPALVQGAEAPESLRRALVGVAPRVDVIILARGGGSLEDLWCFNDEGLARSIVAASVPVVSAIGHETDFTIADFAADLRAPTPSAAAELVSPDIEELSAELSSFGRSLLDSVNRATREAEAILDALGRRLSPQALLREVHLARERIVRSGAAVLTLIHRRLESARDGLSALAGRFDAVGPLATLARGYAIAERADGRIVTRLEDVSVGDLLRIRLRNGRLHVHVDAKEETS